MAAVERCAHCHKVLTEYNAWYCVVCERRICKDCELKDHEDAEDQRLSRENRAYW
jgi:hypothetical protein